MVVIVRSTYSVFPLPKKRHPIDMCVNMCTICNNVYTQKRIAFFWVKLHFLKFFTPKSTLLWPTQIKESSRKSYPPFYYHHLILWNFLVKLSSAKWKSWVRTKWENCSEHKQSYSYYLYKQNKFQQVNRIINEYASWRNP